jgi:shikimate dehydrogenase
VAEDSIDRISGLTGFVALLGHPVAHSLSPRMHNSAFRSLGLDLVYLAFDVPADRLSAAVQGLRALGARGANVTVPHKEAVVPLLDELDPVASRVGAVNTIVREQAKLTGYNTDVYGFLISLERAWGRSPAGASCLVLGAGGAARAVVAGLVLGDAAHVYVYNRTESRAIDLCSLATSWGSAHCRTVDSSRLRDVAAEVDLVVNATSAELHNSVKETALPVDIFTRKQMVFDVLYGPRATRFLRSARLQGAATTDGAEMLVQQAALSFELWTGLPAPIDLMRQEANRA